MENDDLRRAILDSVNATLMQSGITGTTMEAIAAEAGLSKGGLLYYFANKDELLSAAMLRHEEMIYAKRDEILSTLPESRSSMLRATVLAILDYVEYTLETEHYGIGVLAVPACQSAIVSMKKRIFKKVAADVRRPDIVAMILLIMDGIWLNKLFQTAVVSPELEQKAFHVILEMVDACCE